MLAVNWVNVEFAKAHAGHLPRSSVVTGILRNDVVSIARVYVVGRPQESDGVLHGHPCFTKDCKLGWRKFSEDFFQFLS